MNHLKARDELLPLHSSSMSIPRDSPETVGLILIILREKVR